MSVNYRITPEQQLQDKLRTVPTRNLDKLHPSKREPFAEYVEEGLWRARITYQKDSSPAVLRSQWYAHERGDGRPVPTLDAICEEELRRRFPDYQLIDGVKAAVKDKFPWFAKKLMGKENYYRYLTQTEVDEIKKQISFSAIDRDDLVSQPVITDPVLRASLNLSDDAVLETITRFAKNSPLNGKCFDRDGKKVFLSQGLASTSDRTVENTGNLRVVSTKDKTSICYAGRPDSDKKVLEQASFMFFHELKSKRKGLTQRTDGTFQFDYAINSLLSAPWIWKFDLPRLSFPERAMIEQELEALDKLKKMGTITLEDPDEPGRTYQVKFNPIFFTRSLNFLNNIEEWLPPFVTGAARAEEISDEGYTSLETLLRPNSEQIRSAVEELKKHREDGHLLPEEELFVRDYLCKLLNIPMVYHCKSSLDRTSIPVAMSSALQQWIDLRLPIPDKITELPKDYRFKELVMTNLMTGHQISRYACNRKGTVAGEKLKTKILGLTLEKGIIQNPSIARLVPERYLTTYSEDFWAKAKRYSLIALTFLACIPLILMSLINHVAFGVKGGKKRHWIGSSQFYLHYLPLTLLTKFQVLFPEKVLNEESPQMKERHIIKDR